VCCCSSLTCRQRCTGRTRVARPCKTRRNADTREPRNPRRRAAHRINRPPPHVHGKEGVDGSSPSEGLKILQIDRFCCLVRRSPGHDQGGGRARVEFAGVSGGRCYYHFQASPASSSAATSRNTTLDTPSDPSTSTHRWLGSAVRPPARAPGEPGDVLWTLLGVRQASATRRAVTRGWQPVTRNGCR
jgi:hypothetical protein